MQLTTEAVLAAAKEFDRDLRDDATWRAWEENKAHKYAIELNGQLYPVKKIASLASGLPVSAFSGGRQTGQANQLLQQAGFNIVALHLTNPDWTRDELILALDVYLQHRPNPPGKDSREILQLSRTLNRLGDRLFPSERRADTFRNANGVYMKLMNFRRFDPQYTSDGKTGLQRGAKAEEDVWKGFAEDALHCRQVAEAIIASIDDLEMDPLPFEADAFDGVEEAPEGRLLTRKHLVRERNRQLVKKKIKEAMRQHGRLNCEACGFDFGIYYGERGYGFIECHHTKPLETFSEGHKTHINDLALVCSNCHRMIHRRRPWSSVSELKAVIVGAHK